MLGSAVAPIALAFGVLDLTGSKSDLGFVLAATWVPQLILILFGGVFADRLPRHLVMVGANAVSAAAQGTMAVLLLTGTAELWHLIALQVLRGAAFSFFFPASQGLVPQTVPTAELQPANVLFSMTRNGTTVVGAALGGALVAATSPGWALAFDGATYLVSAVIFAGMRLPPRAASVEAPNMLRELAEGWSEFVSRRWLWTIVVAAGIGNMAWITGNVYGPLVAKQSLGGAGPWGVIAASEAAGLLIGGILLLRYRPRRPLFVGTAALTTGAVPLLFSPRSAPLLRSQRRFCSRGWRSRSSTRPGRPCSRSRSRSRSSRASRPTTRWARSSSSHSASRSRGRSRTPSASRTPSGWPLRSWPGPCSQPSWSET